ncbi:MAG: hypothetical protein R2751_09415 [Bacteroidales bacterium]
MTYAWSNDTPAIGLAANGTGDIPSFTAINTGTAPLIATITVTPTFTNSATSCPGPVKTFTIVVNPTAQVDPVSDILACNAETVNEVVFTTDRSGGVTTYEWTNDNTNIGLAASGTGNLPPRAVNSGTAPDTARTRWCPSSTAIVRDTSKPEIVVHPTAQVNVQPNVTRCNEEETNISFGTVNTGG